MINKGKRVIPTLAKKKLGRRLVQVMSASGYEQLLRLVNANRYDQLQ